MRGSLWKGTSGCSSLCNPLPSEPHWQKHAARSLTRRLSLGDFPLIINQLRPGESGGRKEQRAKRKKKINNNKGKKVKLIERYKILGSKPRLTVLRIHAKGLLKNSRNENIKEQVSETAWGGSNQGCWKSSLTKCVLQGLRRGDGWVKFHGERTRAPRSRGRVIALGLQWFGMTSCKPEIVCLRPQWPGSFERILNLLLLWAQSPGEEGRMGAVWLCVFRTFTTFCQVSCWFLLAQFCY